MCHWHLFRCWTFVFRIARHSHEPLECEDPDIMQPHVWKWRLTYVLIGWAVVLLVATAPFASDQPASFAAVRPTASTYIQRISNYSRWIILIYFTPSNVVQVLAFSVVFVHVADLLVQRMLPSNAHTQLRLVNTIWWSPIMVLQRQGNGIPRKSLVQNGIIWSSNCQQFIFSNITYWLICR